RTYGRVSGPVRVSKKGKRPRGRVFPALKVEKKGSGASGRVFLRHVDKQATSANGRVIPSGVIVQQRSPANRCIECTGSEERKGIFPFCCVASRITSVRRRTKRLRSGEKPET